MPTPLNIHSSLIVIADDDSDDRELFTEAIAECNSNIVVRGSVNGNDLMQCLHSFNGILPDLIFLDINMPGKDGRECLKEIRAKSNLKSVPVIIYSTSLSARDIDETFNLGANLYISKPNSFRGLVDTLQRLLSFDKEWLIRREKGKYIFQ